MAETRWGFESRRYDKRFREAALHGFTFGIVMAALTFLVLKSLG